MLIFCRYARGAQRSNSEQGHRVILCVQLASDIPGRNASPASESHIGVRETLHAILGVIKEGRSDA